MAYKIIKAILTAGTATLILNSAGLFLAKKLFHASLAVLSNGDGVPRSVTYMKIIPESYIMATAGILLYHLISCFFIKAWEIFLSLVILITLVWTTGPVSHGFDAATKIVLSLTHFFIAASILAAVKIFFIAAEKNHQDPLKKSVIKR